MKAAQISSKGVVEIVEKPDPVLNNENEIIVRIEALGLCGTDLHTYRGTSPLVTLPRIPGHEIAGEIVQLGKNGAGKYKVGQRVTVWPYSYCGQCPSCKKKKYNCCEHNQTLGVQRDGALQEYLSVPEKFLIEAGELDIQQTALIEPLSVGWHATTRGEVSTISAVAVFGCGLIGLGVITSALRKGAQVIAIDIEDAKLDTAVQLGASYTINPKKENLRKQVFEITDGRGADVSIEAVGNPVTYRSAVEITSYSGRVVYIGYAKDEVAFDTKDFVRKEIEIYGSRNAMVEDFANVKEMISEKGNEFSRLISQEFAFEDAPDAFRFWDERTAEVTKILINF